jgi:hypothetical protein
MFVEVTMVKKTIWAVILVLITTCSIFFTQTGFVSSNSSATPEITDLVEGKLVTSTPTPPQICIPVEPTSTPLSPTATATAVKPTATSVVPSITPTVRMPFTIQRGTTAVFSKNFAHPSAGCNWQGFAGQVFDRDGNPLNDYIVKITGTYNNKTVNLLGVTGAVSGDPYGPGGFEIVLGNSLHGTYHTLFIQLFDPKGTAISDSYYLNTSVMCSKNLGIFNFKEK